MKIDNILFKVVLYINGNPHTSEYFDKYIDALKCAKAMNKKYWLEHKSEDYIRLETMIRTFAIVYDEDGTIKTASHLTTFYHLVKIKSCDGSVITRDASTSV